jgi:ABC-type antimicrobial peptide transport system permease subunit
MVEGSWAALKDQHSIILSRSAAKTLFGTEHALDKSLKIDNAMEVKVTGVYEDLPHNSQFYDVKFFAPWDLLVSNNQWIKSQGFTNNFLYVYVELEDKVDFNAASTKVKDAIFNNIQSEKDYVSIHPQLMIHPMEKWHLWSEWKNGVSGGMIQTIWLFGIIGVFVLLLACINFMNLSTAQSEKRAKEVGIRKTIGSKRSQLVNQFMSESFLVVLIASIVALALVSLSLNGFNHLAMKQIEMPWSEPKFWMAIAGFVFITVLLAGSYPAFYLSSFNSTRVLKGSLGVGRLASLPRKILVVIQFTVSVTLIIGTLMVYKQVQFAKDRPVGYDRNGLMMVQMVSGDFYAKYDVLKTELKNTGVVTGVATSSSPVTDIWNSNGGFGWKGKDPSLMAELATFTVSAEYGSTVGWEFVKGRDLSGDKSSDSSAFVINESAAKLFGFTDPIGEVVQWQSWWTNGRRDFTIVGVIKDQVVKSPYDPPVPAVYFLKGGPNWITFRIDPKVNIHEALPKVQDVFAKVIPSVPFVYKFVDQEFATKFASEERIGVLSLLFTALAILISCLGLFGLASFVAERRAKEIGIRKVVGASIFNLWRMLSSDFAILIVVACCIAVPIAYYFLNEWLAKFDYRTELSWWIFLISCAGALVITLLTVSYQTIKAAWANPVKSLRSE